MLERSAIDAVDTFVNSLKETETYKRYCQQLQLIKQQPQQYEKVNEFRRRNYELQNSQQTDDLFEKMDAFEKEYEEFRENPLVDRFLRAELALCRMMQEVDVIITEKLDFESKKEIPMEEQTEMILEVTANIKKEGAKYIFVCNDTYETIANDIKVVEKLRSVFSEFRAEKDVRIWWRPSRLDSFEMRIVEKFLPQLVEEYRELVKEFINSGLGFLDPGMNIDFALDNCCAYYGVENRISRLFQLSEKPVMIKNFEELAQLQAVCTATMSDKFSGKGEKRAIVLCGGTGCLSSNSAEIKEKIDRRHFGNLFKLNAVALALQPGSLLHGGGVAAVHDGAGRHLADDRAAILAVLAGVHAGHAIRGYQLRVIKIIAQIIRSGAYLQNHTATITTVATIGATAGHKLLTTERGKPVSALASLGKNSDVIYEHAQRLAYFSTLGKPKGMRDLPLCSTQPPRQGRMDNKP